MTPRKQTRESWWILRLWQHADSVSSTERGKWMQSPTSSQETLQLIPAAEGERNPFAPMHSHCVYQPHSKVGPIPRSSWPTKNMNSTGFSFFWGGSLLFCQLFVWAYFCLFCFDFWFGDFLVLFLFLCLLLQKRGRGAQNRVSREVGRIWEALGKWSKYLEKKVKQGASQ